MKNWIVIRVKWRQAVRAAINLENQGVDFYMPRVRSGVGGSERIEPMFPGYAFVRPSADSWVFVKSTVGVLSVLMGTAETPAQIPEAYISDLRSREDAAGVIKLISPGFVVGDCVRISDGPFQDLNAVIDSAAAGDRIYVLLDVFGRQTRVKVDVGSLNHD